MYGYHLIWNTLAQTRVGLKRSLGSVVLGKVEGRGESLSFRRPSLNE